MKALLLALTLLLSACRQPPPSAGLIAAPTRSAAPLNHASVLPSPTPAFPVGQRVELERDLSVRHVMPGVFVIAHAFPWPGNSMLVEMANGELVLVDTPYTPEATDAVLNWTEASWGHVPTTAINTGFHYDNLGGNAALLARGVRVLGSDLTAELLQERGETMRSMTLGWLQDPKSRRYYDAHAALVYTPPAELFSLEEGVTLAFGSETVEVIFPGASHAPDNLVVYFPDRKLLFGGCMVLGGDQIGNTSDADMTAWPDSVRRLLAYPVEMVVPGHGDRLDPALIQHTVDLLQEQPVTGY